MSPAHEVSHTHTHTQPQRGYNSFSLEKEIRYYKCAKLRQSSHCIPLWGLLMRYSSGMGLMRGKILLHYSHSCGVFSIDYVRVTPAYFSTWKPQLVQLCFPPSEQFGEVNTFSPKQYSLWLLDWLFSTDIKLIIVRGCSHHLDTAQSSLLQHKPFVLRSSITKVHP